MDTLTTAVVLVSAALHAGWNAAIKRQADPMLAIAGLAVGSVVAGAALLPWLPLPLPAAWPWLAVSTLCHVPYQIALAAAYQRGELGTLYALMRGTPPLLVALASVTALDGVLGDRLSARALAGIALLCLGLLTLLRDRPPRGAALAAALAAAGCIATYTVLDGVGARAAGDAVAYLCWHGVVQGALLLAVLAARLGTRRVATFVVRQGAAPIAGGVASMLAYGLVLWAMARAPIAAVAALREVSVLFAAWLGVWLFGEPVGWRRVVATALVAAGSILLRSG